jgi:hypothetical protein
LSFFESAGTRATSIYRSANPYSLKFDALFSDGAYSDIQTPADSHDDVNTLLA